MEDRIGRLEEKTDHIQSDVTEIKADIRKMDAKFDGKIDALQKDVSALRVEMKDANAKLHAEMKDMFATLQGEIKDSFGKIQVGRALDKVWVLLLVGAVLGVMAHGFKWI